ncbi:MAG: hypothetical protein AAGA30_06660, partial [Planctomycetota bacterium]
MSFQYEQDFNIEIIANESSRRADQALIDLDVATGSRDSAEYHSRMDWEREQASLINQFDRPGFDLEQHQQRYFSKDSIQQVFIANSNENELSVIVSPEL